MRARAVCAVLAAAAIAALLAAESLIQPAGSILGSALAGVLVSGGCPQASEAPRKRRPPPRDLFPEPILYELKGEEVARANCTGGGEAAAETCCMAACFASGPCEFWVMDTKAGPCRLMRNFSGLAHTPADASRGMFKSSSSLSMDDVLPSRSLEEDLAELRAELARPCPQPDWRQPHGSNLSGVQAWVEWALAQQDGQVRGFPEHDVLLSSKTCIDRDMQFREENPFYLLKESAEGAPAATPPPELAQRWRPEDLEAQANLAAFELVHPPGCVFGQGVWDYRSWAPPLSRYRGKGKRPQVKDVVIADSDVWSNIGHALGEMLFLGAAVREEFLKLPDQRLKLVPVQGSFFFGNLPPLHKLIHDALGLSGKEVLTEERWRDRLRPVAPRCYSLVAQRYRMWPSSPSRYTYRDQVLRQCGLPDRGLCPRGLFWYKKEAGHNMFANHEWVAGSVRQWGRSVNITLEPRELSRREIENMTACQQIGLFADLALFMGVHGAAGIHMLWLPPGAVYMEIAPEGIVGRGSRLSRQGYYGEAAALGGHLYLRYQHAVPLRYVTMGPGAVGYNKYVTLDPRELVAVLQVLYSDWLRPRLATSRCAAGAGRSAP